MKKLLKPAAVFAFAALAVLGIVACGEEEPVTIGVVAPLTGQWDLYGVPIRNGIELAYEELSKDPDLGAPLVIEVRDSKSRPEEAARLLEELYRGGAVAAIGGVTTPEALEMIPVVDREEKVLLSPSATSPRLTNISSLFFRVVPSDFREGAKMANFVAQGLGIDSVVIMAAASPYAKGIQDVFKSEYERYGGTVLDVIEYSAGTATAAEGGFVETDFAKLVDQALSHDPEAVYVADYAFEIGTIIKELKRRGFDGEILTTHAFSAPGIFSQVGDDAEGVLMTQTVFDMDSEEPVVRKFVDAYRAKYGEDPNVFAADGYDAMMVFGEVLRGGADTARDFWKGLRSLRDFQGASGSVQFDEKGDVGKFPRVYAIQDGTLVDFEKVIEGRKQEILQRMTDLQEQQREAARRRAAEAAGDGR